MHSVVLPYTNSYGHKIIADIHIKAYIKNIVWIVEETFSSRESRIKLKKIKIWSIRASIYNEEDLISILILFRSGDMTCMLAL